MTLQPVSKILNSNATIRFHTLTSGLSASGAHCGGGDISSGAHCGGDEGHGSGNIASGAHCGGED